MTKHVYGFHEVEAAEEAVGGDWEDVRALLGGKGANLGEMTRIGIPVPPGFTVTTETCNAYLDAGEELSDEMWSQILEALHHVESETGKRFGDAANPLLVSCRSGAKFSMPGMMDTVLNIGLNDDVVKSMIELTEDPHFVLDSYRRLVQMFGSVVLHVPDEPFEEVLADMRGRRGVDSDSDLTAEELQEVVDRFKKIVAQRSRTGFPTDPLDQLRMAVEAVFKSWNGKRAIDYRNAAGISHDLGTAVNVQTMVFGNTGTNSATGVAMSRNATTGENMLEGDYLTNAQGEDVVAGIRKTKPIGELATEMPALHAEFEAIARNLEHHYRDMQDMEFTVEEGKLWLLQTRDGKRTAQAAVRIAVDLAENGLITKDEALMRVTADQIDFYLHPQFDPAAIAAADEIATGLNVSPGAAVGVVAFDADLAEKWAKEDGRPVIMVRPETKPDDVHGMLAAEGILTTAGGRTSHAALVARQFGKPAVVGASGLSIDLTTRTMQAGDLLIEEGDWLSIDGTVGRVYLGQMETIVPDLDDPALTRLLSWADERRRLGVWANADYPVDAERARKYGAQGIGLCRTEHMFFEPERLPIVQRMIMSPAGGERNEAIEALLPYQREDFAGLFRAMDGLPVTIRLIDPPLHEFLPSFEELTNDIADLKIQLTNAANMPQVNEIFEKVSKEQSMLKRVVALKESNPMLGLRGVRLGILLPELTKMQVRAIFEAACDVAQAGVEVHPKIMIPLVSHAHELERQKAVLEAEAQDVLDERQMTIDYQFGTMIEVPRAALTANEIAETAEFLSFGTNDLTQTTYGISRDDAEKGFMLDYLSEGILTENPFVTVDRNGVGELMRIALERAAEARPGIDAGICGEHGGDPKSIALCHEIGLDYVSCSPFRVPIARLAAAQAAIMEA